jgi:transposase InsO family protein
MKRQVVKTLGVSPRTGRRWQKLAQGDPAACRGPGRPAHAAEVRAEVQVAARSVLERLGWSTGERTVHREIGKYSLYQVRVALRDLRAERRARKQRLRESLCSHVRVLARATIWSLDGTHLGRDAWCTAVVGEIVRDVASTKTLGVSIGPPPSSEEVVVLLQRVVEESGERPLVVASDNGGENQEALVSWCREHGVILLRSLPRTPQHNPWVEHGNGELKAHTGLGKGVLVLNPGVLPDLLRRALDRIDGAIPRCSRGWQTARQSYRSLPCAETLVDRRGFVDEVHCAIGRAVQDCCTWREERLAEREAILQVLERHGLVTRTRGRPPRHGEKPDGVS